MRHAVTASSPSSNLARLFLVLGALAGLATVAMGAVGAHLPDERFATGGRAFVRTAVEMQGWHVPALLACGLLLERGGGRARRLLLGLAGSGFAIGLAFFCAGLYALAFAGNHSIGRLAPIGGSILMIGWALLAAACLIRQQR